MSRRTSRGTVWLLVLLGLGFAARGARAQTKAPDIIVIMADDLDVRGFQTALADGCTTDGRPCLPNLRQFVVATGTTFTESFASQPLCCPSRSTFLTGQYPHN